MEKACCVIDFEGFSIPRRTAEGVYNRFQFLVREIAYVRLSPEHSYYPNSRFVDLKKFEWALLDSESARAIRKQERDIFGLTFWPTEKEEDTQILIQYDNRFQYLKDLQKKCRRDPDGDIVTFYEGIDERNFLRIADLPHVSLKSFNCPKYETLLAMNNSCYEDISCGFHRNGKLDICPKARVAAFRDWWNSKYSRQ